jgi:hypothetical protein
MRPYKVFLAASCRLWLRHHAGFTCGIVAVLIRCLIGRLAASSPSWLIFIVASMPLPHSCVIMLLWKQYETIQGLSCGIMPTLIAASCRLYLQHHCRLGSLSHRTTCGVIAILIDLYSGNMPLPHSCGIIAAMEAVWDQTCLGCGIIAGLIFIIVVSLPLPHFCGIMLLLVAVWEQTWSRLRHLADLNRRLVGQLAASLPTWFVIL